MPETMRARAGATEIAYETFGDASKPPLLLVMGLAMQMLGWPSGFCAQLAARGFHVVRFDNRDIGLSTHLAEAGVPNIPAMLGGDMSSAPYTLSAMAADTVGLMDALGFASAHVVGASMGGMIAQTIAIEHPARVRSLTSIMSTTGERSVGQPTQEAFGVLLSKPAKTREQAQDLLVATYRITGSPAYPFDEDEVRELAGRCWDRAHDPKGVARQFAAILASGDRTSALRALTTPTLVIHGDGDTLIQPSGGRATADAIPGAELAMVEGMGHDIPRALWPRLIDAIASIAARADAR